MSNTCTLPTWLNCRVASRRRCKSNSHLYSSRRLPTDSVDNLETDQSALTTWILIDIDNFLSTLASLCRHLSLTSITHQGQLGHDYRRVRSHRRQDATRLRCRQLCSDSSRLSPWLRIPYTPPTRLNSTEVASASAVCIGLESSWRAVLKCKPAWCT